MAGFKDIIGHEQIIEHFQNAIQQDKVSHAYILNAPDLAGKMMLAQAFAIALQCEKKGTAGLCCDFAADDKCRSVFADDPVTLHIVKFTSCFE